MRPLQRILSGASARRTSVLAGMVGLIWLATATAGHAQTVVTPSDLDRTLFRPSARSGGMGGTYLLYLDDASGLAFNPALLGDAGRYSVSVEAGARTEDVPWDALQNAKDALDELKDALNTGSLDDARGAFSTLYDIAVDTGAQVAGARGGGFEGEVDPMVGASWKNIGVVAYGGYGAQVGMRVGEGTGPETDKRTLTVSGGVLNLQTIEVGYAFRLKTGRLGVGVKQIRSGYGGYAMGVDASNNTVVGARIRKQDSRKVDMDVGFLSDPVPVKGLPGGFRWAATVRNLLNPSFSVPIEAVQVSGPPLNLPTDADFRLKPQIDVGSTVPFKRVLAAMELHNLTNTNGGELTFHLGGEYRLAKWVALRAGLDDDELVAGAGFNWGPVRLDLATGTDVRERLYAGLSVRVTK
jgi:hypothetical protein